MGAAGDMLTAALSELINDKENVLDILNGMGIPDIVFEKDYKTMSGILGAHMHVKIHGEEEHEHHNSHEHHHDHHEHHHHTSMADIEQIVQNLSVSDKVKNDILSVYKIIAEAESRAHGKKVEEIHFHEVGAMDAVADVAAVSVLLEKIGADKIVCSPINVGFGTVKCAHGIMPVPAPATANILQGIPIRSGCIEGELCTPTGAALLKYFADEFSNMPQMTVDAIGVGAGNKEFEAANIVRVFLGKTDDKHDAIVEFDCNIDDATGEELGFALTKIMEAGALDAFTVPIYMKKSRPATLLVVLSTQENADKIAETILKHTTTIGVRKKLCDRITMNRKIDTVNTPYGALRVKTATYKDITKSKPEFDDVARIAQENGKTYREILKELDF